MSHQRDSFPFMDGLEGIPLGLFELSQRSNLTKLIAAWRTLQNEVTPILTGNYTGDSICADSIPAFFGIPYAHSNRGAFALLCEVGGCDRWRKQFPSLPTEEEIEDSMASLAQSLAEKMEATVDRLKQHSAKK